MPAPYQFVVQLPGTEILNMPQPYQFVAQLPGTEILNMPQPYQFVVQLPGTEMQTVQRIADGAFIPFDPANRDYQEFLAWQAEGNEPDPAPEPLPITEPTADAGKVRQGGMAPSL